VTVVIRPLCVGNQPQSRFEPLYRAVEELEGRHGSPLLPEVNPGPPLPEPYTRWSGGSQGRLPATWLSAARAPTPAPAPDIPDHRDRSEANLLAAAIFDGFKD
jgi:hypothetical protein